MKKMKKTIVSCVNYSGQELSRDTKQEARILTPTRLNTARTASCTSWNDWV